MESRGGPALFREIHKNTWLKRLSSDGRKLSTGNKRNDKFWVVFCVHDDCEALLEGYSEPRLAASHLPEWIVSLQTTMHVSHALVPTEQEYEFVVTLNSDVIRFCAPTWDCMQEWVEALRSKLREMKILSPKENVYSKLPEIRPPLLPTRDPTSPLPLPPPVPAAIVPGVECVIQQVNVQLSSTPSTSQQLNETTISQNSDAIDVDISNTNCPSPESLIISETESFELSTSPIQPTAMTNTTPQSLINLLTNPIQAYSNQNNNNQKIIKKVTVGPSNETNTNDLSNIDLSNITSMPSTSKATNIYLSSHFSKSQNNIQKTIDNHSMAKIFTDNVLSDPNRGSTSSLAKVTNLQNSSSCDSQNILSSSKSSLSDENDILETKGADSPTPVFKTKPLIIPRPQTSKSSTTTTSASSPLSSNDKIKIHKQISNITTANNIEDNSVATNITIIQVSNSIPITAPTTATLSSATSADIFNFNIINQNTEIIEESKQQESYNVHILPSNDIIQDIKITNHINNSNNNINNNNNIKTDQYSQTTKQKLFNNKTNASLLHDSKITTVHVHSPINTTYKLQSNVTATQTAASTSSLETGITTITTPPLKESQKIVVTGHSPTQTINFSSVTSISVGDDNKITKQQQSTNSQHQQPTTPQQQHYEQVFLSTSSPLLVNSNINNNINDIKPATINSVQHHLKPQSPLPQRIIKKQRSTSQSEIDSNPLNNPSQINKKINKNIDFTSLSNKENNVLDINLHNIGSPSTSAAAAAANGQKVNEQNRLLQQPPRPVLTRGLTEMAICRQSRIDKGLNRGRNKSHVATTTTDVQTAIEKFKSDNNEQRKRSSSTSDAQRGDIRTNMQPPPQPFKTQDNQQQSVGRLSLREQQVMQLRREMMHPGGVRLQLRRKECISSIAWTDCFGAVWVAGWKQKEHPMLYNALHIGDQLISIGAVTINSAADANKIIRTSPGLYVELIVRRVPFGRVYAIRRDMEGQCLGLIRDGNTAIIIDVVPNSLAARHGLPPKTKSCDGLSLSFWVLTEINGRPLNLFFKENEVRDRLNAVGRDISILVQPLDLVTKLKKQLKSLRGHKDYIVQ